MLDIHIGVLGIHIGVLDIHIGVLGHTHWCVRTYILVCWAYTLVC